MSKRINEFTDAGLRLIKEFEGCKLVAYPDQGGKLTIGYGTTYHEVKPGEICTEAEAEEWLKQDLVFTCRSVNMLVTQNITDSQFSAVVCFAYNVGVGNLSQSTLLKCLNAGHPEDAANEFTKWSKIHGVQIPGLLRRREAERALFMTPV